MGFVFDGATKIVTLTTGTTSIDVRDLWSRWVDWHPLSDNGKWDFALLTVGGNDIDPGDGTKVPIYAFLSGGWRIRPQEADHTLAVTGGILLVLGGGDPFVDTLGAYTVRVRYQQPVQAIVVSGSSSFTSGDRAILRSLQALRL